MHVMDENFQQFVLCKLETDFTSLGAFMEDVFFYRVFSQIVQYGLGHLWGQYFTSLFVIMDTLTMDSVRCMLETVIEHFWKERWDWSSFRAPMHVYILITSVCSLVIFVGCCLLFWLCPQCMCAKSCNPSANGKRRAIPWCSIFTWKK